MALLDWVKLPTGWIEARGLTGFRWAEQGSNATAALMLLIALAHRADQTSGNGKATYEQLCEVLGLSRTKIAAGYDLLEENLLLVRDPIGRSAFALTGFGFRGWGKLPAKRLYSGPAIAVFHEFHLRSYTELNALKLYLLVVARRDNKTNMAHMTYPQIAGYAGIDPAHIRSAISFLAANGLLHIEHVPSLLSEFGTANAYRLTYIDPYVHMGTRRTIDAFDERTA